jgi:hypothetical protein
MKKLLLLTVLFTLSGCGEKFKIPGVLGPNFSTSADHAITNLVIENVDFNGSSVVEIPKIENSMIEVNGLPEGGTSIDVKIDIDAITNGNVDTLEPAALPGGREIPVVGGKLPSVAVAVPAAKNIHIYVGKKVYGIFVPVTFPQEIQGILIYTVKVNGKKYGNVAAVGNDANGANSGVLILADLNTLTEKQQQKLLKLVK